MPLACLVVRVLLIVNTTASSVTARKRVRDPEGARRRPRPRDDGDLAPRATPPGWPAARPARGVEVVAVLGGDGTLNEAADGLVGTETALAPLPGGSTNVYARTLGIAHDPVDATTQLLGSLERRSFRADRARPGERALLPVPLRHRLRRRRRRAGRAPLVRSSATPATRCSSSPSFDTWLRTYDHSHGRFVVTLGLGRGDRGRDARDRLEDEPVHLPRAPAARSSRRRPGLDTPLSVTVVTARHAPAMLSLARRGAALAADAAPPPERRCTATASTAATITGDRAVPVPGRRRLPRRGEPARVRLRAGRAHARRSLSTRPSRAAERLPRDARRVGDDRVDPERRASRTISAGSLTVQTLSASPSSPRPRRPRPAANASPSAAVGMQRPVAVLVRDLERGERAADRRRRGSRWGCAGSRAWTRSIVGQMERRDEHRVVEVPAPRRARRRRRPPGPRGRSRRRGASSSSRRSRASRRRGRRPRPGSGSSGARPGSRPASCSARIPKPSTAASWWTTSAPSALRWTSSSTPSAPWSRAAANAASVFSSASRGAPRWPSTSGRGSGSGHRRERRHPRTRGAKPQVRPLATRSSSLVGLGCCPEARRTRAL